MTPNTVFMALALGVCAAATSFAQPVMLVSAAEATASDSAGGMLIPRVQPQPDAPRIQVLAPDISRPVAMPTRIEVKFVTATPAEAKPETFKALYGAFRLDITQRLLGAAKITKDGISVAEAVLPRGRHQILLSLTDSAGREGQQVISFSVP
jgi:hypothetical protein